MSFQDRSNLMALRISASTVDKARENYVKTLAKHNALIDKALADGTDDAQVRSFARDEGPQTF